MTTPNTLRRLNWLWKHRHTHDSEDFQSQITLIRETVQEQADSVATTGSGAHIHLVRTANQSIATSGAAVSWTAYQEIPRLAFADITFPSTTATIPKAGYYGVKPYIEWDAFTGGGTVQVIRIRDSVDAVVWEWSHTDGQWGVGIAPAIPLEVNDKIRIDIDHGNGSAQELGHAELSIWLIDREEGAEWQLLFDVDNYGVTHDGTNFWTTDDTDDVNPALFERSADGSVVNSYSGYDNHASEPDRNRSIVYAASFLWGVGNNEVVHKVDPSTGSSVSSFSTGATGVVVTGIGYNGTNLFVAEQDTNEIREFNTSGTLQSTSSFPSGREINDLTWDGVNWWATTSTQAIIRMDASFNGDSELAGPTGTNQGIHWRNGFLYVMTPSGLYRRPV